MSFSKIDGLAQVSGFQTVIACEKLLSNSLSINSINNESGKYISIEQLNRIIESQKASMIRENELYNDDDISRSS
jgi:hypothetical protein